MGSDKIRGSCSSPSEMSLPTGLAVVMVSLVVCVTSVTSGLSANTSPALSVAGAVLATGLTAAAKYRIPVWLVWPVAAMAVIAQTVATSALLSVPLTLVLSPMISLVQGFLSIPM